MILVKSRMMEELLLFLLTIQKWDPNTTSSFGLNDTR